MLGNIRGPRRSQMIAQQRKRFSRARTDKKNRRNEIRIFKGRITSN